MRIEDIQIRPVKYKVTKCDLIIPGYSEPYSINDAHIGNFTIEKDFENYVFPYIEFRIIVPDRVYMDIMKDGVELYLDLKIEYTQFNDFYEIESTQSKDMIGTIIDDRFYAMVDNKSPKLTDATGGEKEKERLEENEQSQYSYDNRKAIVLALYKTEHLYNTDQIVNMVLKDVTCADCVAYYFKQCGVRKILFSPPTNSKTYKQMILPPIDIISGLFRLLRTYQMYRKGGIVFFDYDRIYILNKALGSSAWENNEITQVYLTSFPNTSGDSGILKSGIYVNEREKYAAINILGNQISVSNQSMFNDVLGGSNVTLIDSTTGEIMHIDADLNVNEKSPSQNGKPNRVMVMDTGESRLDEIKSEMENAQNTLTIIVQETNIQYLTPNKDYIFTTDNDNYRDLCGHYRLMSVGAVFTKESSLYTSTFTATFVGGAQTI